jgi:hypothetical protein
VGAADQVAHPEAAQAQEALGSPDVARLPAVRGADQGDVARSESKFLISPRLEKREDLEGFGRRPQENP